MGVRKLRAAAGLLAVPLKRFPPPHSVPAFVATGFLGVYTTYSTFTFETVRLLEEGAAGLAFSQRGRTLFAGLCGGDEFHVIPPSCLRRRRRKDRGMATLSRITPCLWFDTQGEEAANYYTGLFEDSRITDISRYGDAGPRPAGTVMTVNFELAGQPFVALNGGPEFTFNEAISLQVSCESQEEVDELWAKLTEGGEEGPCGWCKDRYGLSWQIVPTALFRLIGDPDPGRSQRAMQCMLGMRKIDIAELERAADAA